MNKISAGIAISLLASFCLGVGAAWAKPDDVPPDQHSGSKDIGNSSSSAGAGRLAGLTPASPRGDGAGLPSAGASAPARPDTAYNVFRSVVVPMGAAPLLRQSWRISQAAMQPQAGGCPQELCASAIGRRLAASARIAADLPPIEALARINRDVNRLIAYRADRGDEWSSLAETAARGAGDCDDFALAKLELLRRSGFDEDALQFVVLKDRSSGLHHAVIAVHVDGSRYILDNLSNAVRTDDRYAAYVPMMSFVNGRSYLHGFVSRGPAPTAY